MDGNRKVIFDINIDIPKDKLDKGLGAYGWDTIDRCERTKIEFKKWDKELLKNKKDYADLVGADYIHYTRDEKYLTYLKEMQELYPYLTEYLVINFYKHQLMYELADEYDYILYVDLDVCFTTDEDYFKVWDFNEGILIQARDYQKQVDEWLDSDPDKPLHIRSMLNKHLITYAMMLENSKTLTYPVVNTGLMGSSSKWIKELDYPNSLDEMIKLITHIKNDENSMFTEMIRSVFEWNNEPIFTYVMQTKGIPLINTDGPWNFIVNFLCPKEMYDAADKKVIHMIAKRFDWIFGEEHGS